MSDLISRKALMQKIGEYYNANLQSPNRGTIVDVVDSISEMVMDAPTAYDTEAVVEELEKLKNMHIGIAAELENEEKARQTQFAGVCVKAIEIVHGGVRSE